MKYNTKSIILKISTTDGSIFEREFVPFRGYYKRCGFLWLKKQFTLPDFVSIYESENRANVQYFVETMPEFVIWEDYRFFLKRSIENIQVHTEDMVLYARHV